MAETEKIERIPTGIEGFDELIEGGLPAGSSMLVAGGPGTGKTIAATQMAYNFLKQGRIAVFISFESGTEKIFKRGDAFGWNLREYAEKRQFIVATPRTEVVDLDNTTEDIIAMGKMRHEKGVVIIIDSITKFLEIGTRAEKGKEKKGGKEVEVIKSVRDLRRQDLWRLMLKLEKGLKGTNTTLIFVGEAEDGGPRITMDGVAEYECDGVIVLNYDVVGTTSTRSLYIRKMRDTKHSESVHPIKIVSGKGIIVKPAEEAFER